MTYLAVHEITLRPLKMYHFYFQAASPHDDIMALVIPGEHVQAFNVNVPDLQHYKDQGLETRQLTLTDLHVKITLYADILPHAVVKAHADWLRAEAEGLSQSPVPTPVPNPTNLRFRARKWAGEGVMMLSHPDACVCPACDLPDSDYSDKGILADVHAIHMYHTQHPEEDWPMCLICTREKTSSCPHFVADQSISCQYKR